MVQGKITLTFKNESKFARFREFMQTMMDIPILPSDIAWYWEHTKNGYEVTLCSKKAQKAEVESRAPADDS